MAWMLAAWGNGTGVSKQIISYCHYTMGLAGKEGRRTIAQGNVQASAAQTTA
jgi:hypothetical protein